MPQDSIEFRLQTTAEDYRDGFALMFRRRRSWWRDLLIIVLGVGCVAMLWWTSMTTVSLIAGAALLLWISFLAFMGNRFFSGMLARRIWRETPLLRAEKVITISEAGLSLGLENSPAMLIPWRLFIGYSEDARVLILYDAPRMIRVFPRRVLPAETLRAIVAHAEAADVPRI